eukprot:jgi/Botrbrau1/5676/Bobra.0071s0017.1
MRVSDPQAALPAPLARSSAAIAGGTPVHDGVIRSPLWAFSLLRRLAQLLDQLGFLPFEPPHLTYPTRVHRWKSGRPALRLCTEEDFLDDLHLFLTERKVRQVPAREAFPDAILNGSKLDLFNLYKEVCQRGGIKMGNGINWKGQIFTNMSNYTSVNKMTGVGHALKRHYQIYLAEYEKAHPEDVRSDSCAVCGGGEEKATDWVGCDHCESWGPFIM